MDKIERIQQAEESAHAAAEQAKIDAEQAIDDARGQALTLIETSTKLTEERCEKIAKQANVQALEDAQALKDAAVAQSASIRTAAESRTNDAVAVIVEKLTG